MRGFISWRAAVIALAVGLTVGVAPSGSVEPRWVVTDLGTLGGKWTVAYRVNGSGQVIGVSDTVDGSGHAFLWSHGRTRDLGTLGGRESEVRDVNERGQVVGVSDLSDGRRHGFLWQNGRMTDLGTLPGDEESYAVAINERGQIIGNSCRRANPGRIRAFLWQNGKMKRLAGTGEGFTYSEALAINGQGEVAGRSLWFGANSEWRSRAVRWQGTRPTVLAAPGGDGMASDINEHGQVVGVGVVTTSLHVPLSTTSKHVPLSTTSDGEAHALLWQDGVTVDLGTLPGDEESYAVAINERGQIIGHSGDHADSDAASHSFLWLEGRMTALRFEAVTINDRGQIIGSIGGRAALWEQGRMTKLATIPGGTRSTATAINARGDRIVGFAYTKSGKAHAVLWTLRPGT